MDSGRGQRRVRDRVVAHRDETGVQRGDPGEGLLAEVDVPGLAFRALVHDLDVTDPSGPVTWR